MEHEATAKAVLLSCFLSLSRYRGIFGISLSRLRCRTILSKSKSSASSLLSCWSGSPDESHSFLCLHLLLHMPCWRLESSGSQDCRVCFVIQPADGEPGEVTVESCLALIIWKAQKVKAGVVELRAWWGEKTNKAHPCWKLFLDRCLPVDFFSAIAIENALKIVLIKRRRSNYQYPNGD